MLSRRSLLAAGAGAGLLTACGHKVGGSGLNLLVVTPEAEAGRPTRLAFVLQDDNREFLTPKDVKLRFGPTMDRFTSPVVLGTVHADADPAPAYFTVDARLQPVGDVWVQATMGDKAAVAPLKILAKRPGIGVGDAVPSIRTPTTDDPAGVELVCTRKPVCPWHDVSLDAALVLATPLAVLVATPAFCQTAVCGPVLDVLLKTAPAVGGKVRFLHQEVYATRPTGAAIQSTPLAPVVKAFGLESEPTLVLVGADGKVRERIEGLFGTSEATGALQRLVAG